MLGQILEIQSRGLRVSVERGCICIHEGDHLIGSLPTSDIEAVVFSTPAYQITGQALAAMLENGSTVVLCGNDFDAAGYILPVRGHHAQADRIQAQAEARRPLRKRLWSQIVTAKIRAQAAALDRIGTTSAPIAALATRVKSGDAGNLEALAAQRYFPLMFGREFRRGSPDSNINSCLNYGYTVLRAATARAIIGAGLHPSLSLCHQSKGDALRLADDLMEPFRPSVDLQAHAVAASSPASLTPEAKRSLVAILQQDFETADGVRPLTQVLHRLAVSLAHCFLGERRDLEFPHNLLPSTIDPAERVP